MSEQGTLGFPEGRGGFRKGAGRKRTRSRPGVEHRTREELSGREPLHVSMRVREGLPSLRRGRERNVLEEALRRGAERFGFRLCHYSVQGNHLHMIVEAEDRVALSRGMQGLLVRIAKALNRLWRRRGKVELLTLFCSKATRNNIAGVIDQFTGIGKHPPYSR